MKLMSLLLEENYKVSYSAVVLDKQSKDIVLKNVDVPNGWKIFAHHMTISLGSLPEQFKNLLGKKQKLRVTKLGKSDKAIALGVDSELSLNKIPHITVAINTSIGAKPKDSNEIQDWEDIEPFELVGHVEEVMYQAPFKSTSAPKILNVFDFDGTLLDSPTPEIGMPIYKKLTGNEWPFKGWWGRLESLTSFEVKPLEKTKKLYQKYTSMPNSVNVLMTNRIAKFEMVVKDKLKDYYTFDYYDFKNDHREKPDRISEILRNNPTIEQINIFDDMEEQIIKFQAFKEKNPNLNINIFKV